MEMFTSLVDYWGILLSLLALLYEFLSIFLHGRLVVSCPYEAPDKWSITGVTVTVDFVNFFEDALSLVWSQALCQGPPYVLLYNSLLRRLYLAACILNFLPSFLLSGRVPSCK